MYFCKNKVATNLGSDPIFQASSATDDFISADDGTVLRDENNLRRSPTPLPALIEPTVYKDESSALDKLPFVNSKRKVVRLTEWMNEPRIRSLRFWDVTLPGSHNSATWCLATRRAKGWNAAVFEFLKLYIHCQSATVYQQLETGVRFLDLRVCKCKTRKGEPYCAHGGFMTVPFRDVLEQVAEFCETYPSEIIVLSVRRDVAYMHGPGSLGIIESDFLIALILRSFLGPRLTADVTIGELAERHQNVVYFFEERERYLPPVQPTDMSDEPTTMHQESGNPTSNTHTYSDVGDANSATEADPYHQNDFERRDSAKDPLHRKSSSYHKNRQDTCSVAASDEDTEQYALTELNAYCDTTSADSFNNRRHSVTAPRRSVVATLVSPRLATSSARSSFSRTPRLETFSSGSQSSGLGPQCTTLTEEYWTSRERPSESREEFSLIHEESSLLEEFSPSREESLLSEKQSPPLGSQDPLLEAHSALDSAGSPSRKKSAKARKKKSSPNKTVHDSEGNVVQPEEKINQLREKAFPFPQHVSQSTSKPTVRKKTFLRCKKKSSYSSEVVAHPDDPVQKTSLEERCGQSSELAPHVSFESQKTAHSSERWARSASSVSSEGTVVSEWSDYSAETIISPSKKENGILNLVKTYTGLDADDSDNKGDVIFRPQRLLTRWIQHNVPRFWVNRLESLPPQVYEDLLTTIMTLDEKEAAPLNEVVEQPKLWNAERQSKVISSLDSKKRKRRNVQPVTLRPGRQRKSNNHNKQKHKSANTYPERLLPSSKKRSVELNRLRTVTKSKSNDPMTQSSDAALLSPRAVAKSPFTSPTKEADGANSERRRLEFTPIVRIIKRRRSTPAGRLTRDHRINKKTVLSPLVSSAVAGKTTYPKRSSKSRVALVCQRRSDSLPAGVSQSRRRQRIEQELSQRHGTVWTCDSFNTIDALLHANLDTTALMNPEKHTYTTNWENCSGLNNLKNIKIARQSDGNQQFDGAQVRTLTPRSANGPRSMCSTSSISSARSGIAAVPAALVMDGLQTLTNPNIANELSLGMRFDQNRINGTDLSQDDVAERITSEGGQHLSKKFEPSDSSAISAGSAVCLSRAPASRSESLSKRSRKQHPRISLLRRSTDFGASQKKKKRHKQKAEKKNREKRVVTVRHNEDHSIAGLPSVSKKELRRRRRFGAGRSGVSRGKTLGTGFFSQILTPFVGGQSRIIKSWSSTTDPNPTALCKKLLRWGKVHGHVRPRKPFVLKILAGEVTPPSFDHKTASITVIQFWTVHGASALCARNGGLKAAAIKTHPLLIADIITGSMMNRVNGITHDFVTSSVVSKVVKLNLIAAIQAVNKSCASRSSISSTGTIGRSYDFL